MTADEGSSPRVRGTRSVGAGAGCRQRFIPAGAGNASAVAVRFDLPPVHPRGCGERGRTPFLNEANDGSSPRVRGTPAATRTCAHGRRFIPAGAGNAGAGAALHRALAVHPRGCGERHDRSFLPPRVLGSSPRVRGTRLAGHDYRHAHRFIPAGAGNAPYTPRSWEEVSGSSPRVRGTPGSWFSTGSGCRFIPAGAGNATAAAQTAAAATVHPRGCGEREIQLAFAQQPGGSSPRVRGTRLRISRAGGQRRFIPAGAGNAEQTKSYSTTRVGSSPRVRGTLHRRFERGEIGRFIPAGAGNACPTRRAGCPETVHPRGCGERALNPAWVSGVGGSSPRVRGTRVSEAPAVCRQRFIPAGAGNATTAAPLTAPAPVHPRGCGERAIRRPFPNYAIGSSPRVRGTPVRAGHGVASQRFIPAGAGNASTRPDECPAPPVHPRGCGERDGTFGTAVRNLGSSPRVRGTRKFSGISLSSRRFIPAGAGNASRASLNASAAAVHPRGCGERWTALVDPNAVPGSSPRVRGTLGLGRFLAVRGRFIPAGAGNAIRFRCGSSRLARFIPAGAGNARPRPASATRAPVHPRGCGERWQDPTGWAAYDGSSPRVRGTPLLHAMGGVGDAVHPRGCGERAIGLISAWGFTGSSPRVRGTRGSCGRIRGRGRFIPAGAGNALARNAGKQTNIQLSISAPKRTFVHRPRRRAAADIGPGWRGSAASAPNRTRRSPSRSVGTRRFGPQVSNSKPASFGAAQAMTALPSSI